MRTFAQKQNQRQKQESSSLAHPNRAISEPDHREHPILYLQRTIGNQATLRMLQTNAEEAKAGLTGMASSRFAHNFRRIPLYASAEGATQTKLAISGPEDIYEQEADRVADEVMSAPAQARVSTTPPGIQRVSAQSAEQSNAQMSEAPTSVGQTLAGPGQPLEPGLRQDMEQRFGHDFSRVRVHTGAAAEQSARDVNANAYTVGHNIVFDVGRFAPETITGARLLAHELTHVVQQSDSGATVVPPSQIAFAQPSLSSGIALYRDDKSAPAAPSLSKQDRPGAAWPYGPITKHKTAQYDLSTYIGWVKEVEKAYGPNKQAVLQRLRRLYYSTYSGAGGAHFDRVIAEQAGVSSDTPLDARVISPSTLDGLYETNVVLLPDGQLLDVSHLLAALDLKTSGTTWEANAAEQAFTIKWQGVVTWTGDLANYFVKWIDRVRKQPTDPEVELNVGVAAPVFGPDSYPASEFAAQKVALLSDMDAQTLVALNVGPSKVENVKAEGRPIIDPNVGTELSDPVSAILEKYYNNTKSTELKGQNRFEAFVRRAVPPIPYKTANEDGSGPVTLAPEAENAIYEAIYNTAWLFIKEGRSYSFGPEMLDQETSALHEMARRFTQFLITGLKTGDAPWP